MVIPKSGDPGRMKENLEIFDFALDPQDLAELAIMDEVPGAGNNSDSTATEHHANWPSRNAGLA